MAMTRREFGRAALAGVSGTALLHRTGPLLGAMAAQAQPKPDSSIGGVQIGVITYSYRSLTDQSAEATLRYVLDSGISAIELMGDPVERFAGAPQPPALPKEPDAPTRTIGTGSWAGRECAIPDPNPAKKPPQVLTPAQKAAKADHARQLKAWRTSVSMDAFKKLRRMYNDAGVMIYAWKQDVRGMSDAEYEYIFNVAQALGCTHTTFELRTDPAELKRMGDIGVRTGVYAAYHTHLQGGMTAIDQAFAASPGNRANVDFGHWVAGGNKGGTPLQFLEKHHDRIASFHLKDRTTPEHCALNLPWGSGETPIREILQSVQTHGWKIPASIEVEYDIPKDSDAVREVRKCLEYCRRALVRD